MALAQVLRHLPTSDDPNILVGPQTADDAGVYRLSPETALINTLDFFTPVVDDPYSYGAIVIANALSDVYAMGGVPLTALNIVCFPDHEYPLQVLEDILQGGADKLKEAGCALIGGHSVQDRELKYGAAITGLVHPDRMATNAGAHPGDRLILTKRLGTGIVTTAAKFDRCSAQAEEEAVRTMAELNRAAAEVMVRHNITACTDVTGFGLVGHAYEMAHASGVLLRLQGRQLPVLTEAYDLAAQGVETMGWSHNREYVGPSLHFSSSLSEPWQRLAVEAETSGGLLMAVPEERAGAVLADLHAAGVEHAQVVGNVEAGQAGDVWVE